MENLLKPAVHKLISENQDPFWKGPKDNQAWINPRLIAPNPKGAWSKKTLKETEHQHWRKCNASPTNEQQLSILCEKTHFSPMMITGHCMIRVDRESGLIEV